MVTLTQFFAAEKRNMQLIMALIKSVNAVFIAMKTKMCDQMCRKLPCKPDWFHNNRKSRAFF